jgi:hypothetical protein
VPFITVARVTGCPATKPGNKMLGSETPALKTG